MNSSDFRFLPTLVTYTPIPACAGVTEEGNCNAIKRQNKIITHMETTHVLLDGFRLGQRQGVRRMSLVDRKILEYKAEDQRHAASSSFRVSSPTPRRNSIIPPESAAIRRTLSDTPAFITDHWCPERSDASVLNGSCDHAAPSEPHMVRHQLHNAQPPPLPRCTAETSAPHPSRLPEKQSEFTARNQTERLGSQPSTIGCQKATSSAAHRRAERQAYPPNQFDNDDESTVETPFKPRRCHSFTGPSDMRPSRRGRGAPLQPAPRANPGRSVSPLLMSDAELALAHGRCSLSPAHTRVHSSSASGMQGLRSPSCQSSRRLPDIVMRLCRGSDADIYRRPANYYDRAAVCYHDYRKLVAPADPSAAHTRLQTLRDGVKSAHSAARRIVYGLPVFPGLHELPGSGKIVSK